MNTRWLTRGVCFGIVGAMLALCLVCSCIPWRKMDNESTRLDTFLETRTAVRRTLNDNFSTAPEGTKMHSRGGHVSPPEYPGEESIRSIVNSERWLTVEPFETIILDLSEEFLGGWSSHPPHSPNPILDHFFGNLLEIGLDNVRSYYGTSHPTGYAGQIYSTSDGSVTVLGHVVVDHQSRRAVVICFIYESF